MARILKKRIKRSILIPEIMLTPLIDTALTLLVIFIVTAPMVQNNIKVDLPYGKGRDSSTQQDFVVSITKDEKVFFNSFPVKKNELIKTVQSALRGNANIPVYVEADKSLSYGQVVAFVDQLKGLTKTVVLSTKSVA